MPPPNWNGHGSPEDGYGWGMHPPPPQGDGGSEYPSQDLRGSGVKDGEARTMEREHER